jgi:monoamine oxidase
LQVLQREMIDFSPALPAAKQTAIKSMDCEPALKVLAKFSARFWPENLHGMVCTDSFAPELWFDMHKWDGHTSFYVTAFFTSDQARAVGNMSTEHAFTAFLDQLSLMFKCDSRQFYAGGFIVDWGKVPFIWGGYTTPSMRELPHARAELARPVDGALFFAGEATDPDNFMTAHAAMASGVRAAKEAMVAIDARAAAMKIVSKM